MDTLVTEALARLNHPTPEAVIEAATAARRDYSGAVSAGAKRTRSVDPDGAIRLNTFLLPLVYVVNEDGVAQPIPGREADFGVLSIVQGEYAHHTRETGLSSDERAVGYNCVISQWKGVGTGGNLLSVLYLHRKNYAAIPDHCPLTLARFVDIIIVVEALLGDPVPEPKKSAAGVAAFFNKRR